MGFKNNCWCTCWANKETGEVVQFQEKYADISISINKKQSDGSYKADFQGKVRFLGKAFEKLKTLAIAEKDRLHLLEVEVTNYYDKAKGKLYTNAICWDFEPVDSAKAKPKQPEVVGATKGEDDSVDDYLADLPF